MSTSEVVIAEESLKLLEYEAICYTVSNSLSNLLPRPKFKDSLDSAYLSIGAFLFSLIDHNSTQAVRIIYGSITEDFSFIYQFFDCN